MRGPFCLGLIGHLVRLHGVREEIGRARICLFTNIFKSQLKRLDCFFAFSVERKLLKTLSRRSRLDGTIKPLTYTSSVVSLDNVRPCVSLTTEVSHKLFQLTLNKRFDNMFSVVNSIRTT